MFAPKIFLLIGIVGISYGYPSTIDEIALSPYNNDYTNFDSDTTYMNSDGSNGIPDDFFNLRAKRQSDLTIEAEQERGRGTTWKVDGDSRIWTSDTGRSTLDGNVHYERGGDRDRDFRGGFTFKHRF